MITAVNGNKITDAGQLQVQVGETQPGSTLNLSMLRDGKEMSLPVTLENMDRAKAGGENNSAEPGKPRWGIGLQDLTPDLRQEMQAPSDVHGAVITDVQPGSSADHAQLQRGEIILEVNRHKVESAAEVRDALKNVPAGQDALLLVYSNGGNTYRVLHASQSN